MTPYMLTGLWRSYRMTEPAIMDYSPSSVGLRVVVLLLRVVLLKGQLRPAFSSQMAGPILFKFGPDVIQKTTKIL